MCLARVREKGKTRCALLGEAGWGRLTRRLPGPHPPTHSVLPQGGLCVVTRSKAGAMGNSHVDTASGIFPGTGEVVLLCFVWGWTVLALVAVN